MIKKLNFKFGILQVKKDLEILHKHIIRVLLELFLFIQ